MRLTLHVLPFPPPKTTEHRRALQAWIHGHHAFFVSLVIATHAAKQVTRAVHAQEFDAAEEWTRRLVDLRLGTAAFTCAAGNMSRETYEGFIRVEMEKFNPEFSGLSSLESWAFDEATKQMKEALATAITVLPDPKANNARRLLAAYENANRKWWEHHGKLMRRLLTVPISLARKSATSDALDQHPKYNDLKNKYRAQTSLELYDRFFACRRALMSLARFQCAVHIALDHARPHQDQDPELTYFFTQAERTIKEILEERLRHEA